MLQQSVIFCLSLASVGFLNTKRFQCFGSFFGIVAQPFWMCSSYAHSQWGIFFLGFVYGGLNSWGLYNRRVEFKYFTSKVFYWLIRRSKYERIH